MKRGQARILLEEGVEGQAVPSVTPWSTIQKPRVIHSRAANPATIHRLTRGEYGS